jgi:hypothetical protein
MDEIEDFDKAKKQKNNGGNATDGDSVSLGIIHRCR